MAWPLRSMLVNRANPRRDLFDRLAIGVSAICFVHCAASVIFVTMLAAAGGALLHPAIHEAGLVIALILAIIGLGRGFLQHRRRGPMLLGTLGIAQMAAALSVPHGLWEAGFTMAGVSCVAIAHLLNRRAAARGL